MTATTVNTDLLAMTLEISKHKSYSTGIGGDRDSDDIV